MNADHYSPLISATAAQCMGRADKRRSGLRHRTRTAFTLLELLVAIAIIATLLSLLLPALGSARSEGTKIKCLAHLRELGIALSMYSNDDSRGMSIPIHPRAETSWYYDGEYEYGGNTGLGVMGSADFRAENRLLNKYLFEGAGNTPMKFYQCPTDQGIQEAPVNFDTFFLVPAFTNRSAYETTGTSFRINNHIDFMKKKHHFYGPYMRPTSQIPDSSTTVVLEETVAEVAKWNAANYRTMGWHRKANIFNVLFADGHAGAIRLAGQQDFSQQYGDYWVLRGENWRMDCYPRPRICDLPRDCDEDGGGNDD